MMCIYRRRPNVNCPAGFDMKPNNKNAIITTQREGKRSVFNLNKKLPLNKDDWLVVPDSGICPHSDFCNKQVKLRDRTYDLEKLDDANYPGLEQ